MLEINNHNYAIENIIPIKCVLYNLRVMKMRRKNGYKKESNVFSKNNNYGLQAGWI